MYLILEDLLRRNASTVGNMGTGLENAQKEERFAIAAIVLGISPEIAVFLGMLATSAIELDILRETVHLPHRTRHHHRLRGDPIHLQEAEDTDILLLLQHQLLLLQVLMEEEEVEVTIMMTMTVLVMEEEGADLLLLLLIILEVQVTILMRTHHLHLIILIHLLLHLITMTHMDTDTVEDTEENVVFIMFSKRLDHTLHHYHSAHWKPLDSEELHSELH